MNNLKIITMIVLLASVTACSDEGLPFGVNEECLRGVVYCSSGYKLAPALKPDGSLYTCGN